MIYEINRRFLQQVRMKYPGNDRLLRRCRSLTSRGKAGADGQPGHSGVPPRQRSGCPAQQLVRNSALPRIRRDLAGEVHQRHQRRHPPALGGLANPQLAALLDETIGQGWPVQALDQLRGLEAFQKTPQFLERWGATANWP
jgi:starch phosphorylase